MFRGAGIGNAGSEHLPDGLGRITLRDADFVRSSGSVDEADTVRTPGSMAG